MDEAHTVESWADFRESMPRIGEIRKIVPDAKMVGFFNIILKLILYVQIALTATAPHATRQTIFDTLKMTNPRIIELPVGRTNIYFEVVDK